MKKAVLRQATAGLCSTRGLLILLFSVLGIFLSLKIASEWQNRRWKQGNNFTIVYAVSPTVVVNLNIRNKRLTFISIPDKTYTETDYGYGRYLAGSLWLLGLQEKNHDLLKTAVRDLLGAPVDGYFGQKKNKPDSVDLNKPGQFGKFKGRVLTFGLFRDYFDPFILSDLKLFDLLKFWWYARDIGSMAADYYDLGTENTLSEAVFPDGGAYLKPQKALIDNLTIRVFGLNINMDKTPVSVHNGSAIPGLGAKVQRLLTNSGVNVVAVDNAPLQSGACLVRYNPNEKKSGLVEFIAAVYQCQTEKSPAEGIEVILRSGNI